MKIPEKYLSLVANIDERAWYYILGGILFALFLMDYFVLMGPQIKALTKINPEINILSVDILRAKDNIAKIPCYKKTVGELKEKIVLAGLRVKSKEDVYLILEEISLIANENGVKIDQIMPNSQEQELILENNTRRYFALPILIEVKSGYHKFGHFLNEIETGDNFLTVDTFDIMTMNNLRYNAIKMAVTVIVYGEI